MMFLSNLSTDIEYTCGNLDFAISGTFPYIVSLIVLIIKIAVPVLLIIFGMLDLAKAVIASKEDEIKKGQQTFIKRLVASVIVFFVVQIVQIIVRFAAGQGDDSDNIMGCFNCFISGEVSEEDGSNGCKVYKSDES